MEKIFEISIQDCSPASYDAKTHFARIIGVKSRKLLSKFKICEALFLFWFHKMIKLSDHLSGSLISSFSLRWSECHCHFTIMKSDDQIGIIFFTLYSDVQNGIVIYTIHSDGQSGIHFL